jgi:hypothetical protein
VPKQRKEFGGNNTIEKEGNLKDKTENYHQRDKTSYLTDEIRMGHYM